MPSSVLAKHCLGALSKRSSLMSASTSIVRRNASSSFALLSNSAGQQHQSHRSSGNQMAPFLAMGGAVALAASSNSESSSHISQAEPARQQVKLLSSEPQISRTLKEMNEQPEAIARALNFGECMSYEKVMVRDLDQNQEMVSKINHVTLSAQGASMNAARYGERLMKQLGSFSSVASVNSEQMQTTDLPCLDVDRTGVIVVSECKGAKGVQDVVACAMDKGVTVINTVSNLLGGDKNGASSNNVMSNIKAFTTQVTALALIALWFKESRNEAPTTEAQELKEALMKLPIAFGMTLKKRGECRKIAKRLQDKEHCLVLGKGFAESVAHEGAFNISEISHMDADYYKGGAIEHVLCSVVEGEAGRCGATPVIMFILNDEHAQSMRLAAKEAKARGADLIIITDDAALAKGLDNSPIVLPSNGPLTALGGILPLQLIAYELAVLRGINPDAPSEGL